MAKTREEIIRKAILEKLGSDFYFFTADDILAVAGIDEAQLKIISDSIRVPPQKRAEKTKNNRSERRPT